MKLAYFNDYQLGVLKGDRIVDVTDLLGDIPRRDNRDLMAGLVERFGAYRDRLSAHAKTAEGVPFASVRIRAPFPRPRQIDCMAVNYMENGTLPQKPPINAFHKTPSSVIGPGDTMVLPDVPASVFEVEAEMAVVIGSYASNISAATASQHIFGFVNFADGSARELPPPGNTFFQVKSRDTFCPMGPYVVTADEIPDPQKLQIRLWVSGVLRQDFNTCDMAHSIADSIAWLSSVHSLEPGDIIATGTNHRGLGALHDGDLVEMETEGLGRLSFRIRDDLKRTWTRKTRFEASQELAATGQKPPPTGVLAKQLTGKYAKTAS